MGQQKKLNVAVIGAGMVAATHLRSVVDLKNKLCLSGVLSRTAKSAAAFAAQAEELCGHPIRTYEDVDAICADNSVDFALVLTPPNVRVELVEKLAEAGKSVLMEKPIERTVPAARQIVEICEACGVSLGIVFQHRVREASRALADLIASGPLGALALAEVSVPWWRDQGYYDDPGRGSYERDGGGVLISQAIHTLDLMLSLTGRVHEVQAMASTTALHRMESEDFVSAGLRFENGAVGSLVASTASYPGKAESITLHFEKAVAHLARGELQLSWRDGRLETFGASASTGGGADPMAFTHAWHRDVIEDFCDALAEGRAPLVTGREALDVQALIEAIVTSSAEKRACVVNYDPPMGAEKPQRT